VMPRYPAIVDSVSSTAVFTKDALIKNDQLIAFNNKPFLFYHEFDQLKKPYQLFSLKDYYTEEWFESKGLVFVPRF